MSELSATAARWLTGPDGLRQLAAVTDLLAAGVSELEVGRRLRRDGVIDPVALLGAAAARRRAVTRWPDAQRLVFTPQALEQASDPGVAAWRARRFAGGDAWDLCAGIGGDTLALGRTGEGVVAVERDPGLVVLLEHNAGVRRVDVRPVRADVMRVRVPDRAVVHADPARRREGRRLRRLADYEPAVPALAARVAASAGAGIVVSPAVSWEDPGLPRDAEVEFVQVDTALVEAVVWMGGLRTPGVTASATLLPSGVHRKRTDPIARLPTGAAGAFLVDVAPAGVRARLHDAIGREIGARRLAARRALLTTDDRPPPSPWYQARPVEAVLPARPRAIRRWLRSAEPAPLEIAVHGLDHDPVDWWRELGRPPRGPRGRRLELVRTDDGAVAVVCLVPGGQPQHAGGAGRGDGR